MPEPGRPVEITLVIAARPQTIFRYYTHPARFARWMGQGSVFDPEPGGRLRVGTPPGRSPPARWWPSSRPGGPSCSSAAWPTEAASATRPAPSTGAGPLADHIGTVQRMTGGARLDGRFRWVTGFWDPRTGSPAERPAESPEHPEQV
jgi:hypothetical protein